MDKDNQNTGEFVYVKEKVFSKRKRKAKKVCLLCLLTIFLAGIFGITARIVFISSERLVNRLLGIEDVGINSPDTDYPDRGEILFPVSSSLDTETEGRSVSNEGEDKSAVYESNMKNDKSQGIPGAESVTIEEDGDISDRNEGNDNKVNAGEAGDKCETRITQIVQKEISPLEEYARIMSEIRRIADKAKKSILPVTAITDGVSWMNESIETSEDTIGIVMGENQVELLVLTRYDKVIGADSIEVEISGKKVEAEIFSYDSDYNIAILAIPLRFIPVNMLDGIEIVALGNSAGLYEGMPVIALGSPNGHAGSVEYGFVTGTGNKAYTMDNEVSLFTTDLSVGDDSDGIIVNHSGKLVGIITHSIGESGTDRVNTSVCINSLKRLLINLLNNTDRRYFGIHAENIPTDVLGNMELENGIYVNEVEDDSPAAAAGIKKGDVIISFNGNRVRTVEQFGTVLSSVGIGRTIKVDVYRVNNRESQILNLTADIVKKVK